MKQHFLRLCVVIALSSTPHTTPFAPEAIYGHTNLNVPLGNYKKIAALITALDAAGPDQKQQAIAYVVTYLKKTQETTDHYIHEQYTTKNTVVPPALFFKQYITRHQIAYLQNICVSNNAHATSSIITQAKNWLLSALRPEQEAPVTGKILARQVIDYIDFEREQILYNYTNQLLFFTSVEKEALPELINFWGQQDTRPTMYAYARLCSQQVRPQFGIDTLIEFAVQGVLMAANSMAIEWVDEEDAKEFEKLQTAQNKLQDDWSNFATEVKNQSQKIMNNVLEHFKQSMTTVQKTYETSNQVLQRELQYLSRSVSLAQSKSLFLDDRRLDDDLAFEAAPMRSPKPHTWYNVAQKGDWQFDASSNSFWQNGLQPYTTDSAGMNSIFTEAIINGASYEIEVECTLYSRIGSPFFMGIMFNKARWLSGDPERLTGYRLLGLYGTAQHTVDAAFAEQTIIPAQGSTQRKIISPLQNIEAQPTTRIATNILADQRSTLGADPITFVLNVTTKPEEVTCTITQKTGTTAKQLAQKTITGLNKYTFIYHGIGFMAPGCQASFKITKPERFVYSPEQLQAYNLAPQPQEKS